MSPTLRIAVADDEPDMRDFFEKMLPLCGHQVVSLAETGRELLEHCRQLKPDLVITDVKMPDMDGIEASIEICRERRVPIIIVSAYHDPELVQRAEADSVLAYLVKPIGQVDLQPAINVAMRRFEELQSLRQEAADLRQALTDRKVIERAKGILMDVTGVDERGAFRRLQELASDQNLKLIDVAQTLLSLEKALRPASRDAARPA
jgi:response regulator NasT